jgi:hypothetical protein
MGLAARIRKEVICKRIKIWALAMVAFRRSIRLHVGERRVEKEDAHA